MSPQFLLEHRHKKRDFSIVDGLGLFITGLINDLDPGLQSAMVVRKPLGYPPDRSTRPKYEWKRKLTSWSAWQTPNNVWRFSESPVRTVRASPCFAPTLTGVDFRTVTPDIKNLKVGLTVLKKRR
jgi:hypothetical protein